MPLSGLRVVELGCGSSVAHAAAYAGRLFAGLGADVRKIEPPEGDPSRAIPPLVEAAPGHMESAWFAWLNTNKHSLTTDNPASAIATADLLLDARPLPEQSAGPLAHAALRQANPDLTIIALSWFGEDGPYRDYAATDATCRALAGLFELIGPKAYPLNIIGHQTDIIAGLSAFIAGMASLLAGGGRRQALSVHEACILLSESHTAQGPNGPRGRWGVNRFATTFPIGVYPCREGWLGLGVSTPQQWVDFCDLFEIPEVAANPRYRLGTERAKYADEIEPHFAPKILQRTAAEWFAEGLARKLPFAIVPSMAELLDQKVMRDFGAFPETTIGAARFAAPAIPLRLPVTPPLQGGPAPLPGQAGPPPHHRSPLPPRQPGLPLAGTRVVDFTMGWAGPLVARTMADLGAEVIKIESRRHYDWWRGQDHSKEAYETRVYEKRPLFLALNRNKTGITLDLTTPEGIALAKRLIARADAVVENYSSEVMPKLGLDYASLSQVNPDLVMVSMPAFPKGPWETGRAYGFTLEQAAGVPSVTGEPNGPPMLNHYAYGDPMGGLNGTAALLAGLWHKRLTGEGQHIALSQVECMIPMVAPWLIAQSVTGGATTGATPPRMGNRHPHAVPHNVFPCANGEFIFVAVTDTIMWHTLCDILARPDWRAFATAEARRPLEAEIEAALTAWTRSRDPDTAMAQLQAAGIAAGVVRSPFDLASDPHLAARNYWHMVDRAISGPTIQSSLPFREDGAAYPVRAAPPTMGQYNRDVLCGVLGLTDAEFAELQAREIIGTTALPPRRRGT